MSEKSNAEGTITDLRQAPANLNQRKNGQELQENPPMILEMTSTIETGASDRFLIRPATMDDIEPAVELFNICSQNMYGKNEVTLPDVLSEWLLPEFVLDSATRVATTPEGRLVGYVEVWDINERPVDIWVWGRVHPDFEGQGIGTALMDWAEERARQAIDRVPNGIQVAMRSGTYSGYDPAQQFLEDRGMKLIRHFYTMAIDLVDSPPEPQWPAGIKIRPMAGLEETRDMLRAVRDAFRDHWGYVEQPFEDEYERWLHFMENDQQFDPNLYYLAMDGDEIAGVCLCVHQSREDENMGWVRVLGVRRPWRRQGLGLAMLHYSFGKFYRHGQARVGLGVDASSLTGATRLYERAGMRPIHRFDNYQLILRPGRDISLQELKAP